MIFIWWSLFLWLLATRSFRGQKKSPPNNNSEHYLTCQLSPQVKSHFPHFFSGWFKTATWSDSISAWSIYSKRLIFKSTKYIWQVHNLSIPTGDETFRVKCFLHISPLLILYYAKPHYLHTLNRYRKRLFLPSPQFVLGEGPKGKVQTLLNQPVAGEQLLYLLNIHGVILYKGIREKNLIKYIKF